MQQELKALQTSPVEHGEPADESHFVFNLYSVSVIARPNANDLLQWHFVVFVRAVLLFVCCLPSTVLFLFKRVLLIHHIKVTNKSDPSTAFISLFPGGYFWGSLQFPADYPMKPPAIRMFTPSGRFVTNSRLCLSISDFHPESWSPLWNIGTILTGLVSFMCDSTPTLGSIEASDARRRDLAARSLEFNQRDPLFLQIFPDAVEEFTRRSAPPQVAASSSSSSSSSSTTTPSTNDAAAAAAVPAAVVPAVVQPVAAAAAVAAKARPTARAGNGATPIADALTYVVLLLALIFAARFAGINVGWK